MVQPRGKEGEGGEQAEGRVLEGAWRSVGGSPMRSAGAPSRPPSHSRVTWQVADASAGRPARSRAARLAGLCLAVSVSAVALGTVFHDSAERSVPVSQRMVLLQSHVTALRAQDFVKSQGGVPETRGGPTAVNALQAIAAPAGVAGRDAPVPAAQPVPLGAQASGLARAEAQVATVVPKMSTAQVKGVAVQEKKLVAPPPPPPPPAVKLDKHTQQQLEDEIRALRQAQEKREMKFMKEAALATANEIARDKQDEEKKAVISHQEHVNAVAMSKMHVAQEWAHHMAETSAAPATETNEVEEVLQKAMDAQTKGAGKKAATTSAPASKVAAAKAQVERLTAPKALSPAEQKAIKAKEAADAKLVAQEKAKEDKMAAKVCPAAAARACRCRRFAFLECAEGCAICCFCPPLLRAPCAREARKKNAPARQHCLTHWHDASAVFPSCVRSRRTRITRRR